MHYQLLTGTGHYYYLRFSLLRTDGHSYPNGSGWCITDCSLGPDIIITCGSPSSALTATATPMVVVGALPTAPWEHSAILMLFSAPVVKLHLLPYLGSSKSDLFLHGILNNKGLQSQILNYLKLRLIGYQQFLYSFFNCFSLFFICMFGGFEP